MSANQSPSNFRYRSNSRTARKRANQLASSVTSYPVRDSQPHRGLPASFWLVGVITRSPICLASASTSLLQTRTCDGDRACHQLRIAAEPPDTADSVSKFRPRIARQGGECRRLRMRSSVRESFRRFRLSRPHCPAPPPHFTQTKKPLTDSFLRIAQLRAPSKLSPCGRERSGSPQAKS
jgi:hypothetical protein